MTDAGIKKAYRKLSLLTHPDKNGYAGADEAFKMVSRAFQVLSDADKKSRYDQFGGDPDNRFSGAASGGAAGNPFAGFARAASSGGPGMGGMRGAGGGMFEEEISPEELFRQFFGGGDAFGGGGGMGPFGGGLFDSGPGFVFGGPGGVRVHQFGGNRPRRRPAGTGDGQQAQQPTAGQALLNLLPILLIFVLPILSSLFSGSGSTSSWGASSYKPPSYNIDHPLPPQLTSLRTSQSLKVPYYTDPATTTSYDKPAWRRLDMHVENSLMRHLDRQCGAEEQARSQLFQSAQGWFSVDQEAVREARGMPMVACGRLQTLQRRQNMWF